MGTRFYACNGQTIAKHNATAGLCWALRRSSRNRVRLGSLRHVILAGDKGQRKNKARALRLFDRYGGSPRTTGRRREAVTEGRRKLALDAPPAKQHGTT
jgi:hypothetical protein